MEEAISPPSGHSTGRDWLWLDLGQLVVGEAMHERGGVFCGIAAQKGATGTSSSLGRFVILAFSTALALFLPPSALGYVGDEQAHVVVTADGTTLTSQAQNWIKSFDQTAESEWQAEMTANPQSGTQPELDLNGFKELLRGRMLPLGGLVLPPAPGQVTKAEVCHASLSPGCWLYERDDTNIRLYIQETGNQYCWHLHAFVDENGQPNGEQEPWGYHYPSLTGKRDIFMAQPCGNHAPIGLRKDIEVPPGGQIGDCGVTWEGAGGYEAKTAETEGCPYLLNGEWYLTPAPRMKWWKSAAPTTFGPEADDPTVPNVGGYPADPNWADQIAQELQKPDNGRIRDWIAHQIDGTDNPYDYTSRLSEYGPELRYSVGEAYFALSAASITDAPGNKLMTSTGNMIASNYPPELTGAVDLSLNLLDWPDYTDWNQFTPRTASEDDYLDEADGYLADATLKQEDVAYKDRAYGRINTDSSGKTWLQYWFFYYYNPQDLNLLNHEGDWEMVQYGLSGAGRPDVATYAQHDGGERCLWDKVQKPAGTEVPLVFVARDSHASYFAPDTYPRYGGLADDEAHGDYAPPRPRPSLVSIADSPGWIRWRGIWGASGESSGGPVRKEAWDLPGKFNSDARTCRQGD